jgi:hypothetical protein
MTGTPASERRAIALARAVAMIRCEQQPATQALTLTRLRHRRTSNESNEVDTNDAPCYGASSEEDGKRREEDGVRNAGGKKTDGTRSVNFRPAELMQFQVGDDKSRLAKNPQWINEEIKKHTVQGDLFA